jgi:hypothetical protein
VIGIHVSDARSGVSQVVLDLSIWDVGQLSGGDVPDIETWRSVSAHVAGNWVGLSRGQDDRNHFGYTLAASVEGAGFVTHAVDARTTRLIITPSSSYTIWIACASRLNAPDHDSVRQAEALLDDVASAGYARTLAGYEDWWHSFWAKSFVQYSTSAKQGDYLENLYYLYTYIIAAGSYANYPFHFINGDFSAVEDAYSSKWSVAYWYWNQRLISGSFLASNHPEILRTFNRLYSRNLDALAAQTQAKYGIKGVWVPETIGWDGNARHTDASDWTKGILSTGAEAAENMFAEYEYTRDAAYLRTTVYAFVKGVAEFYTHRLSRDAAGKYFMAMSNAHETYWGVRDPITDLAAIRSLLPIAIRTSRELGVDAGMRHRWRTVLDNLAPYPMAEGGSQYAPHDPPAAATHNWENVAAELIWPYGVTGIGSPDFSIALDTWRKRPYPYGNIWSNDAIQAARLGLGDEVLKGLNLMIKTYQSNPNGLTNDSNGRFEYLGAHLYAINESLLQSYNGKIRAFPAVPTDGSFVGRFTLLAKGGFLVSSEYVNQETEYLALQSLHGHAVTVENPWNSQAVRVRRASDDAVLATTAAQEFTFDTRANTVYIIERVARPLNSYFHKRLTGSANQDVKLLTGSQSALGAH